MNRNREGALMTSEWDLRPLTDEVSDDRVERFAAANGMTYGSHAGRVGYPGMIFRLGVNPRVSGHLMRPGADFLDIGNYSYTIPAGRNSNTYTYGFVAIKLDRMVPHLVLDSRTNDFAGISQLPVGFARNQELSLEGGFGDHFTLYCPKGYERDALYLFTPDLMALLMDEAGPVDVEVIDDWVFLYRFGGFDLADPRTMRVLFRIIDTVGERMLRRSGAYADSRMNVANDDSAPARMLVNEVSAQGRRLKSAPPRVLLVASIVCAVLIVVPAVIAVWVNVARALG